MKFLVKDLVQIICYLEKCYCYLVKQTWFHLYEIFPSSSSQSTNGYQLQLLWSLNPKCKPTVRSFGVADICMEIDWWEFSQWSWCVWRMVACRVMEMAGESPWMQNGNDLHFHRTAHVLSGTTPAAVRHQPCNLFAVCSFQCLLLSLNFTICCSYSFKPMPLVST